VPPGAVVVPPVTLLPLACAARCRHRAASSSCRPSPFVFLGGQSEKLDLTKAQWHCP
jgi:hypothetical protein